MTDLKLTFNPSAMLRLTGEQFRQLATTGETITGFAPAKNYPVTEGFSKLFLAFDGSLSNYFFEFDPKADIDIFIKNSYLTNFFPKSGKINLIKDLDKPLIDLLPGKRDEITGLPVFELLTSSGNFKGQISCCDCGEPGCSSEYLWADNYIGLASFHIIAAALQEVRLYPFKLS
jgi:hypothetical protein